MDKSDYRKALQAAKSEFERLIQERVALDQRIVQLKHAITSLSELCDVKDSSPSLIHAAPLPPRFMRLTSAIRQTLAESTSPIRPLEMRKFLQQRGLNMSHYANKLAVIHNTLRRLERQGEVTEIAAGWIITEKGRSVSRVDTVEFVTSDRKLPSGAEKTPQSNEKDSTGSKAVRDHKRTK